MDKSSKSQILKLSLIAALLIIAPLLSNSLRPTYLYFILNLLIITLGVDAGFLSFSSKASEEKLEKRALEVSPDKQVFTTSADGTVYLEESDQKKAKAVQKCFSEKINARAVKVHIMKKCPSTPSLFFIAGGADIEAAEKVVEEEDYDEEDDQVGVPSGQELFHKAEMFIGNFYKQLKMQREDSWKKIHGLYHKAF